MMNIVAFFNNKGGVGKTTLVYHLAWMFSELGRKVVVADLDPQSNLTSMFLDEDRLEKIWNGSGGTIYDALKPIVKGTGDIAQIHLEPISDYLNLIVGNLALAR